MISKYSSIFNSINIASILFYFIPLALLTGPFLPDLFLSIIGIIFIIEVVVKKKYNYFNNNFFYISLLFCFYIIIRSLFSVDPYLSLESSLFYFRFMLFALAVWYLIDHNENLLKYFTLFFLGSFTLALCDGYYQFFNSTNLFGVTTPSNRMSLLFSDKLILGGYLSRLFPLLIGLILLNFKSNRLNIFLFCTLLILTDILIFITGERTALGLLLLSSVFIIFCISKYKIVRLLTIIVSLTVMIVTSFLSDDVRNRNINQTLNQIGLNDSSSQIYIFSEIHQSHIISAYRMFQDNPIFGKGPKIFRTLCNDNMYNYDSNSCSTHPHNSLVQLLAETGLIGITFFIAATLYVIFIAFSHFISIFRNSKRKLSDFQVCIIACFILTLWPIAPSNNFFNNWISVIYYLPVGFYLNSIYCRKHDKKNTQRNL